MRKLMFFALTCSWLTRVSHDLRHHSLFNLILNGGFFLIHLWTNCIFIFLIRISIRRPWFIVRSYGLVDYLLLPCLPKGIAG